MPQVTGLNQYGSDDVHIEGMSTGQINLEFNAI